jgi:putative transposase
MLVHRGTEASSFCGQHDVAIVKGHVSTEHVHLLVSIPPQTTISRLTQWLKRRTAHRVLALFPHLKKQFWGRTEQSHAGHSICSQMG